MSGRRNLVSCLHTVRDEVCTAASVEPAVTPVDQAKAIDLLVGAGRGDPALAAPPLARPDPSERGVEGDLHLILQLEVGLGEQGQQRGQVGRQLIPQGSRHQLSHG